ncbi:MAG: hypothetical protein UX89_C0030G0003 [Parcubacteria group bacterium GW2011_GWA2_47_16]|nr:MAG: hypothetical protein UX89_C0030G0003 [Parcubacteria group bacterium GW2011_GWA2_47_16]
MNASTIATPSRAVTYDCETIVLTLCLSGQTLGNIQTIRLNRPTDMALEDKCQDDNSNEDGSPWETNGEDWKNG